MPFAKGLALTLIYSELYIVLAPCKTDTSVRAWQVKDPERVKYVPDLKDCVKAAPRLTGCEAAYFFPRDIAVCPHKTNTSSTLKPPDQIHHNTLDTRNVASGSQTSLVLNDGWEGRDQSHPEGERGPGEAGVGNLVIHVRSGDIFFDRVVPYKGQVSSSKLCRRDVLPSCTANWGPRLVVRVCQQQSAPPCARCDYNIL